MKIAGLISNFAKEVNEIILFILGVIVLSMNDLPLGFGVAAKSTADCKLADPLVTVCFHQADIGEYVRSEYNLL